MVCGCKLHTGGKVSGTKPFGLASWRRRNIGHIRDGLYRLGSKAFFIRKIFDLPQIVVEVLLQGRGVLVVPIRGDEVA